VPSALPKSAIVLAGVMAMFVCFARGAEPLKIGMVAPLTGADVESGRYQTQGAKLAAEEVNKAGGVLGRQISSSSKMTRQPTRHCARVQQACRRQGCSRVHRTRPQHPSSCRGARLFHRSRLVKAFT
jgi:hypothetical protein